MPCWLLLHRWSITQSLTGPFRFEIDSSVGFSDIISVGTQHYFIATDGINGQELWRIGEAGLAEMVEDSLAGGGINPGAASSNPSKLINVNGTLYFRGTDGVNGVELWRINSSGIAQMVEDGLPGGGINPGAGQSLADQLTNVNGTLFFVANDGVNGAELWRVNGSGIAEIVEGNNPGGGIRTGSAGSFPSTLNEVNGTLYFAANDGTNGTELWRISSPGLAVMVEDAIPGGGIVPDNLYSPRYLTNVNGTLYFTANDGSNGLELWRVNDLGMAQMVEDGIVGGGINPGVNSSHPEFPTNIAGTLYFSADDGTNGTELWRINNSGIAELVDDSIPGGGIRPGTGGSVPSFLTNVGGTLFFSALELTNGSELWSVNAAGIAILVEDSIAGGGIRPGNANSEPRNLINVDGVLYFTANDGTHGITLWKATSVPASEVTGAFVYHKDSGFDSSGVSFALDDVKSLAMEGPTPQKLTYDNLINTSFGINGLVFDIANLPVNELTAADFDFQMSPQGIFDLVANPPANWQPAPNPSEIAVHALDTSRVTITWPNDTIINRWLRVIIKANANTFLTLPEVYYLGHLRGETTGLSDDTYTVSFADIAPIRSAVGQIVGVGNTSDIDKNATVAFSDVTAMRSNIGVQLSNITIPASSGGGGSMALSSGSNGTSSDNSLSVDLLWSASRPPKLDQQIDLKYHLLAGQFVSQPTFKGSDLHPRSHKVSNRPLYRPSLDYVSAVDLALSELTAPSEIDSLQRRPDQIRDRALIFNS